MKAITALSNVKLDSRKSLSAYLQALANGKNVITSSNDIVDNYLTVVKHLNLTQDEEGATFLSELSLMVLDTHFPLLYSATWFRNLLKYHQSCLAKNRLILTLKPISFYQKLSTLNHLIQKKYPQLVIDSPTWALIATDMHILEHSVAKKINFYQRFQSFIEPKIIHKIHKMNTAEFTLFELIMEYGDVKSQHQLMTILNIYLKSSYVINLFIFTNNFLSIDKLNLTQKASLDWFMFWAQINDEFIVQFLAKKLLPKIQNKLTPNHLDGTFSILKLKSWLAFLRRNQTKIDLLKAIDHLPIPFLLHIDELTENPYTQSTDVFDYLAAGKNIRYYDNHKFYFTTKMARIFHHHPRYDLDGLEDLYWYAAIRSTGHDEMTFEAWQNARYITDKKEKSTIIFLSRILSKTKNGPELITKLNDFGQIRFNLAKTVLTRLDYSYLTTKRIDLILNTIGRMNNNYIHQDITFSASKLHFFKHLEKIDTFYRKYHANLFPVWFLNWQDTSSFDSFFEFVIPLLNQKKSTYRLNSEVSLSAWLSFWNRNIAHSSATEIIHQLQYLSPYLIKNLHNYDATVFDHLASGKNIRYYNQNHIYFTKKMAHIFHHVNVHGTLEELHHFCASETIITDDKIKKVLSNHSFRMGTTKRHLDALQQLITKLKQWNFVDLDSPQQRSILGYINHGYQDIAGFSLKSTTLNSIIRRSNEYYIALEERKLADNRRTVWQGTSRKDFKYVNSNQIYRIIQLKSLKSLTIEGQMLHHCVSSYAAICVSGATSIWSMRDAQGNRMVTIQLVGQKIVQIKGEYNRAANEFENIIINAWATKERLIM